jgi:starch synthase
VSPLHVLAVTPEIFPLVKTGGLADVTGALPLALRGLEIDTTTLVPGYPPVMAALAGALEVHAEPALFGGPARLLHAVMGGLDLLVLDAPHLFARSGNPYLGPDGQDWPDNASRFAALGHMASRIATGAVAGIEPDILHAHDWQAGLAPVYLHYQGGLHHQSGLHYQAGPHGQGGRRPGTIMTVHNLAFQGIFPAELLPSLGLPPESFSIDGVEYYGSVGFLKGGLALADRITTVSPGYAAEIQTPEGAMGLIGLIRTRADVLHGILNGIDDTVWNPDGDTLIPSPFSLARLDRRARNKAGLQDRFGLAAAPGILLLGVISRLTSQKGLDLLLADVGLLGELGIQLALLGSGERAMEAGFLTAAAAHPGHIGCIIGYDEALAHLIQAGSDALLVPSRFEPCGLTQLCALRYGAIPVVSRVGGLADTVIDANEAALATGSATGIQFSPVTADGLGSALRRMAALWRDQAAWRKVQRNGMKYDVSWRRPAAQYAALYRDLVRERAA